MIINVLKQIWKGHSLARALMNESFRTKKLGGKIVDIGGGRNPDYFSYFKILSQSVIEPVDKKIQDIDFETDTLPYGDSTINTVVCCNLLEHIYNHQHLTREMFRVLQSQGVLVGFVPFLVQYHPDPHDYFRYTEEALKRIFTDSGFTDINVEIIGIGPIAFLYNVLASPLPKVLRLILFVVLYPITILTVKIKPALLRRFPLGYTFVAQKS